MDTPIPPTAGFTAGVSYQLLRGNDSFEEQLRVTVLANMKEALSNGSLQDLMVASSILSVFQSEDINDHVKLLLAEIFDNLSTATVEETKIANSIASVIYSINDASKDDVKEKLARGFIVLGNVLLKL